MKCKRCQCDESIMTLTLLNDYCPSCYNKNYEEEIRQGKRTTGGFLLTAYKDVVLNGK